MYQQLEVQTSYHSFSYPAPYRVEWLMEIYGRFFKFTHFPQLRSYMEKMYDRTKAPLRIAVALAAIKSQ